MIGRKHGVEAAASWTGNRSTDAWKTLRTGFPPLPQPNVMCTRKYVNNVCSIHTLAVNATQVVHSGDSGNNGGYHTNPVLLEGPPNEISW